MKKKFLNALLVAAMLGGTATSFVSCKDNDADVRTELQGQFTTSFEDVIASLENSKKDLQQQIDELNAKLEACGTDCGAMHQTLSGQIAELKEKVSVLDELIQRIEELEKFNADDWFTTKLPELQTLLCHFLEHEGYLRGGDIKDLVELYLQNQLSKYLDETEVNDLIEKYLANYLTEIKVKELLEQFLTQEQIEHLIHDALNGYVTEDGVMDLLNGYTTTEQLTCLLKGYLTKDEANALLAHYLTENEINLLLTGYYTKEEVDKLFENYLDKNEIELLLLKNYMTKAEFEQRIQDLLEKYLTKEDLEGYLTEDDLKGYLTEEELIAKLDKLAEAIAESVDAKVQDLRSEMKDLLRDLLSSMITGIEINATENPLFGSAALPVDIRTTILGAYYGHTSKAVKFPSSDLIVSAGLDGYVKPEGWDAGELLFDETKGNAGKLYLTINPNTVDFENQLVSLVTSQGNESPIKLDTLRGSDKELSFGYTRATNANGFYEAAATLKGEDIEKVKVNVDFGNMKDAAQEVLSQRSKTSVAKLASTFINEALTVLNMPAYGVKASWTDYLDNDTIFNDDDTVGVVTPKATEHNVVSQYAIAATAVKPLSYDFMKDAHYNIPGIERIENFVGGAINNLFKEIKKLIPDLSDLENVKLSKIELDAETREKLKVHYTFDAGSINSDFNIPEGGIEVIDENGEVVGHVRPDGITITNDELVIEIDLTDKFDVLVDAINDSLNLEELQKALDNLCALSNLGSDLDGLRDKIKNGIFGYIDRLNSIFSNLVGSVNTALQPCLLFIDAEGSLHRVTTSKTGTQIQLQEGATSIELAPTSYTAELFAPAFKKFIAVTDVTGAKKTVTQINQDSEGFGEILSSGDTGKNITLKNLEKGCTYEITYSALDYYGNTCTKKFYIAVK